MSETDRPAPAQSVPDRSGQSAPSPVRTFKTQADAVAFLNDYGYKLSAPTFSRAVKSRKVGANPEGHFEEGALLAYAAVRLEVAEKHEDRTASRAATERLTADTDLKRFQAERLKLKLEREQGKLMPRAEYERDLAARALFFKNEVRNFIHLHGAAMIHLTGGQEGKLPALVRFWEEKTGMWMDAWSQDREFSVRDGDAGGADDMAGEEDQ